MCFLLCLCHFVKSNRINFLLSSKLEINFRIRSWIQIGFCDVILVFLCDLVFMSCIYVESGIFMLLDGCLRSHWVSWLEYLIFFNECWNCLTSQQMLGVFLYQFVLHFNWIACWNAIVIVVFIDDVAVFWGPWPCRGQKWQNTSIFVYDLQV